MLQMKVVLRPGGGGLEPAEGAPEPQEVSTQSRRAKKQPKKGRKAKAASSDQLSLGVADEPSRGCEEQRAHADSRRMRRASLRSTMR